MFTFGDTIQNPQDEKKKRIAEALAMQTGGAQGSMSDIVDALAKKPFGSGMSMGEHDPAPAPRNDTRTFDGSMRDGSIVSPQPDPMAIAEEPQGDENPLFEASDEQLSYLARPEIYKQLGAIQKMQFEAEMKRREAMIYGTKPEMAPEFGPSGNLWDMNNVGQGPIWSPQAEAPEVEHGGIPENMVSVPDPNAPGGFRVVPMAGLEAMPGEDGPPDFDQMQKLRKEYNSNATVKTFTEQSQALARMIGSIQGYDPNNPGPSDIALVYAFMKMQDPKSVVRETEYATAENAGGVPEYLRNTYNRLVEGGRLTPDLRQSFGERLLRRRRRTSNW